MGAPKGNRNRHGRRLIFILMSAAGALSFAQGSSKSPAAPSPKPKVEEKLSGREWLEANRGAPDFAARLSRIARDEDRPADALLLIADFYPVLSEAAGRAECASLAGEYAELLSRFELAAQWYDKAAQVASDGTALKLRAARCLMAAGEFDAARSLIEEASAPGGSFDPGGDLSASLRAVAEARMSAFWLSLFQAKTEGLESGVLAFLSEVDGKGFRPEGLLLLSLMQWRSMPADASRSLRPAETAYGKRLIAEYPDSPEAELARGALGAKALPKIRFPETPLWLLGGFLARGPDSAFLPLDHGSQSAASVSPTPLPQNGIAQTGGQGVSHYQVGTFAQRANAENLVKELAAKSFQAEMRERRNAKGQLLYAVVVASGKDPMTTDLRLKEAGFEALPLFE